MLKHFSKENFGIFFKALKNERPSLIFKNALNKLRGISKAIPAPNELSYVEKNGVKIKITEACFINPKECQIVGWISSDQKLLSLNYIDENSIKTKLNLKKLDAKISKKLTLVNGHSYHSFEDVIPTFGTERNLNFLAKNIAHSVSVKFDISPYLNTGIIPTHILNQYHHPNKEWHRDRTSQQFQFTEGDPKLICFYLPQYHQIPENDEWWGKGFTEWTNVTKALPKFEYHYQPRLPADLGFYDLRNPKILLEQTEMAKQYGIHGFCFHYYWFGGRKILEMPVNQFKDNQDIDFKYCLNWANENWTRAWDGAEDNVLLKQDYSLENVKAFYDDIATHFHDDRYIKVEDQPMFLIYRSMHNPNIEAWIEKLNALAVEDGFSGLHIVACQSIEKLDTPSKFGADRTVQFPPHHMATMNPTLKKHGYGLSHIKTEQPEKVYNKSFKGDILNYSDIALCSYNYSSPTYEYETVFPSWDNCARKDNFGTPFIFSTPKKYGVWLNNCLERTKDKKEKIVFINAWNEWAEGAYLEPDRHFGYGYLQETAEIMAKHCQSEINKTSFPISNFKKEADIAMVIHLYYVEMWDEIKSYLLGLSTPFDLYITITSSNSNFKDEISKTVKNANVIIVQNRGRDVGPFFEVMSKINHLGYKYIAKLHSKKSPHAKNGSFWRSYSFDTLIGTDEIIEKAIHNFENDPSLGVQAGFKNIFSFKRWGLGSNEEELEKLSLLIGIEEHHKHLVRYCKEGQLEKLDDYEDNLVKFNTDENILKEEYIFPAGTMFWFRPKSLEGLFSLGIGINDFPTEAGQLDGTMAHAIERMVGLVCKANNYKIGILA